MTARNDNKTKQTKLSPRDFIAAIDHERKREEAGTLLTLFKEVTGWTPKMWGPSMIGFGRYHYVYDSGREGDSLATGFSPRKAAHSIYIMPGYQDYGAIMARLGKHKLGKSCLYVNKLADIDLGVLRELIAQGVADLSKMYKTYAS